MLYSGIDDELATMSMQATSPQSLRSFGDVCKHSAADIAVPKTYVATTQDLIVPYAGQLQLAQAAGAKVVELDCGHSPFLTAHGTAVLVEAIQSAADQIAK
jgi:pimeloyl-ACP methyl ester carboxylesterase